MFGVMRVCVTRVRWARICVYAIVCVRSYNVVPVCMPRRACSPGRVLCFISIIVRVLVHSQFLPCLNQIRYPKEAIQP